MIALRLWSIDPNIQPAEQRAIGARMTRKHVSEVLRRVVRVDQFFKDGLGHLT